MKIYIASSWNNTGLAKGTGRVLRAKGHDVDIFCDESSGRYVFYWFDLLAPDQSIKDLNALSFLRNGKSQKAFREDKKWLDWCECVVMVLPCGNSAHLEAGYAKGQGKKLIIYAPAGFQAGEFDVMYGFADLITDKFDHIIEALEAWK